MKEFFHRLSQSPRTAIELFLISFIANILALASPIFVMLVLGRYIAHGVDATLVTLTLGVILSILLEFTFRTLRLRLAKSISIQTEAQLSAGSLGIITTCAVEELGPNGSRKHLQIQRDLENVSTAFNANNLSAILDVPFALLFLLVLYILHPVLGLVATGFIFLVFFLRQIFHARHIQWQKKLDAAGRAANLNFNNLVREPDSVRLFDTSGALLNRWQQDANHQAAIRSNLTQRQALVETSIASLQVLLGVAIIGLGATFVVAGDLSISSLIGANILAARALAPVSRLAQLTGLFDQAAKSLENLKALASLQSDTGQTSLPRSSLGVLELRDISFTHPAMPIPLYERLSVQIPRGSVLLIRGGNGTGKTTLIRLMLGLLAPDKGQIFADGIDIRQLTSQWWREQFGYLPQEPWFFDASLRENIQMANPTLDEQAMLTLLEKADLRQFVDENVKGLDMPIQAGGSNLASGIRKRLAIARLLAKSAPIVYLDEPTESMDEQGHKVVGRLLDRYSRERRTTIIASNDEVIAKRAHYILDLDHRPTPNLKEIVGISEMQDG